MREEAGCAGRPGGAERREVGLRKACRGTWSSPAPLRLLEWCGVLPSTGNSPIPFLIYFLSPVTKVCPGGTAAGVRAFLDVISLQGHKHESRHRVSQP